MATPDWTDHDVSDPGVTLIELLPFLGEQLDFRNPQGRRRLFALLVAAAGLLWLLRSSD